MDNTVFPQPSSAVADRFGIYPTDFIVESILDEKLKWFRSTPKAEHDVFGRLLMPQIAKRYGEAKIAEIAKYIRDTDIRIIQAFPAEDAQMPMISINLGDSAEAEQYSGLNRFAGHVDNLGPTGNVVGRQEVGYIPIQDSILIGIHASGTPDKVKYLYQFVAYSLASSISQFEAMGFFSVTQRATDMSRFNEYLPANIFTRFMTLTLTTMPRFKKDVVPMVDSIVVNVGVPD